jgi:hypothetical protein
VDILQERVTLRDGEGERRRLNLDQLRKEVSGGFRGEAGAERDGGNGNGDSGAKGE